MTNPSPLARPIKLFFAALILLALYLSSLYSYLLFHVLAELFSILIAAAIFILVWNFRLFYRDGFLIFIGVSYLFTAGIDLLHTLAYKDMQIFTGYDANLPTQLWLAARYLQSISLLAATYFIGRKVRFDWLVYAYAAISALLVASIFAWNLFPDAYIEGVGLTPFKIISEYVIIAILGVTIWALRLHKNLLDARQLNLLMLSVLFTIAGEAAFTAYLGVFDLANLFGHFMKILATYLIYKASVESLAVSIYTDMNKLIATERALRKTEASERARVGELEALMDAVPAVVWMSADTQCRVVTGNRASYELLRLPVGSNLSKTSDDRQATRHFRVFKGDLELAPEDLPLQVSARLGIEIHNYEERIVFEDGEERYLFGNVTPLLNADGSPRGAVAAFHDITELKQAQAGLEDYASRLERSNHELEQFAFVASHDLQEPLRKVIAFSDRLTQTLDERLNEQERDYLARIANAVRRMQVMIDGLLVYSRVTTAARPFEPVDLGEIVKDVVSDLEMRIERTQAVLEIKPLPIIDADPLQMRQLFLNLIGNALKFHRPDAHPEVRVDTYMADNHNCLSIYVRDNGLGFSSQNIERIFRPFERLHGREIEGTGMGLAICQKIVERHGGVITAESEPNQGATFIVRLPVHHSAAQLPAKGPDIG